MDIVICSVTNLFRIYLVQKFVRVFFGNREQAKWKIWTVSGAYFLINTGLYLAFHLAWINVISNLLGISLLIFLQTKALKTNLFITCSIYLINMGCDIFVTVMFVDYNDGQAFQQVYSVLTVFLIFICEIIAEKIISYNKNTDIDEVQNLPLILVPLCSISIIVFSVYGNGSSDVQLMVLCVGLLIVNFLVLYLYNAMLEAFEQKYDNEVLKQKIAIYSNQINVILQSESKVKTLRHDMKHHLNELKLLAMKGDSLGLQEYIDSMEDFIHNPDEIVASGNMEIDSILNYMLARAKKSLKTVNAKVILPEDICHSFDINIILENLLENAIEAAAQTEEKMLNVNIQLKKGVLRIEIENSFNGVLNVRDDKDIQYVTTKKEQESHGIGLKSVKKIIHKYNGIIDIIPNEKTFCVKALLYMTKMEG